MHTKPLPSYMRLPPYTKLKRSHKGDSDYSETFTNSSSVFSTRLRRNSLLYYSSERGGLGKGWSRE